MTNKNWSLWLGAIRDGFVSLLPLTFFRVGAELIQHLPINAYQNFMSRFLGNQWSQYFDAIIIGANSIFSLSLAVLVAVHLSNMLPKKYQATEYLPALTTGLAALINYMLLLRVFPMQMQDFGIHSLFLAVMVGLMSAELLHWISHWRWPNWLLIPYDTDATFFYALRATGPVILVTVLIFLSALLFKLLLPTETDFAAPLLAWSQQYGHGMWWLSIAATLINQFFWSIGFHGGLMLDANFGNVFAPAGAAFGTQLAWRPVFDNFVLIGGAGATLGLLIATLHVTKEGTQRQIARISVVPSLFNINDILLYGLPIVLNPLYLLPFILVPLVLVLITLGAVEIGFIQFTVSNVSWTTPPLISGWLLTNSWHGVALQVLSVAVSTAIYLPFVRRAEQDRKQKQAQAFADVKKFILSAPQSRVQAIHMQGQIGIIARRLLTDLRKDIRLGRLNLAYQPKHDLDGKVLGVEALLRWKNEYYGALPPGIAVNLAEEGGDIDALGLWILSEACACKARWNALGYQHLIMAVNVSPVQLKNAKLPSLIQQMLQQYALDPAEIELEITESSVLPEGQEVDKTLQQLADLGVRIALDDFGMGYSSLLYMRRIHLHTIKVDGSLTRDVLSNSTNADIVRAIAALGIAQHVDVVAEFVEQEEQLQVLKDLGCNIFQGYLYSAPLDEQASVQHFYLHNLKSSAA